MKRLATVLRMACASAALAAAETSAAPSVSLAFPEEAAPKGCAPAKGLVLWRDTARARPDLSSAVSLEFSYCLPCDVAVGTNAEGGVAYDWRPFDAILDDIASRRHQAVVRFRYAYPGERLGGVKGATAVPSFFKSRSDYRETFAGNPGGDGPTWYPDWSCRALEDFTLEFYGALAKRYDDDPRLAFLEVGFGHWAEYHTYGTPLRPGVNFPSVDFQRRFFRLLASELKSTPWMVSIDSAARGEQHSPAVELCASGVRFGLFDDSFMCAGHEVSSGDGDNELNWRAFGDGQWRHSPRGGEISYYRKSDQRDFLGPDGIHGVTWAQACAKYRMTFAIANDAPRGKFATRERFLEAQRECGYSLAARGVRERSGGLDVEIANEGVAPFYFDAAPAFGGIRAEGTLKGLQPGESRVFFVRGASGGAALEIASPKFLR